MPALGLLPLQSSLQQNTDRIRLWFDIFSNKLWSFFAVYVLVAGVTYFAGPFLIDLYTKDIQAAQASQTVLFYAMLGVPFTAGTLILTALWQGLGNARLPFYATTIGMWLVRIGIAYLLVTFLKSVCQPFGLQRF